MSMVIATRETVESLMGSTVFFVHVRKDVAEYTPTYGKITRLWNEYHEGDYVEFDGTVNIQIGDIAEMVAIVPASHRKSTAPAPEYDVLGRLKLRQRGVSQNHRVAN